MGGMQALQWAASDPDFVTSVIAIATTPAHSPQQIAFNEIARRAVMADPRWCGGDYAPDAPPADGLAVARMVGHVTYLSDRGMQRKFGRRRRDEDLAAPFGADFEVERYLDHQGRAFVDRFDANTLLYLTKALDRFDLGAERPLAQSLAATEAAFLFLAFSSDWLYAAYQLAQLAGEARAANRHVVYQELASDYGHDAFLLEHEAQTPIIRRFLADLDGERSFARSAPSAAAVYAPTAIPSGGDRRLAS
jgi:homoserine O-acetyltransferase